MQAGGYLPSGKIAENARRIITVYSHFMGYIAVDYNEPKILLGRL